MDRMDRIEVSTSVLCDKKVRILLKSRYYKAIVKQAMLYELYCWAVNKKMKQRTNVSEMRIQSWIVE